MKAEKTVTLHGVAQSGVHFALVEVKVPLAQCKVLATGSKREVSEAIRHKLISQGGPGVYARAVVIPL